MADDDRDQGGFREFFRHATGISNPYPYQDRLATDPLLPELLSIPTGLGKTAAVILAWLWRRRFAGDSIRAATPRRLIYCLPMRVLVEQTYNNVNRWLEKLGLAQKADSLRDSKIEASSGGNGWYAATGAGAMPIAVSLLMGGEEANPWDRFPEREAILVGTQDMLLSRAMNRGYGMSRFRWPMHFGLLHNDCLWVMDETQLMGVGLTTTAQLQGLRTKLTTYGAMHSLWMSATLDQKPICTVDHPRPSGGFRELSLSDEDRRNSPLERRLAAKKPLKRSDLVLTFESEKKSYCKELAAAIRAAHRSGALTLVVLNRVSRSQDVFIELQKSTKKEKQPPELALIHARFRPHERRQQEERLLAETLPDAGRIVVATQAIEAGVDVSSLTLFTELAPWPSLVQRFGRCNRGGEFENAEVFWIDVRPKDEKDKTALPYDAKELDRSREFLAGLAEAGPEALAPWQKKYADECEPRVVQTLRRKDLLELWDTTPDLAGNDLDISRFIRDSDDADVQFFWRHCEEHNPTVGLSAPTREELCSVSIGKARDFLGKIGKESQRARVWSPLDASWKEIGPNGVRPGMVLLLQPEMGGYLDLVGWTGDSADIPAPCGPKLGLDSESMDDERSTNGSRWVELTEHLRDVTEAAQGIVAAFASSNNELPHTAIVTAAQWHDVGKAHSAFQNMLLIGRDDAAARRSHLWAKSAGRGNGRPTYWVDGAAGPEKRIDFRHELASALAWLAHHGREPDADLVAFLIAAHHGKVRESIRSLPNEVPPPDESRKFARGIWDKDNLPLVRLPSFGTEEQDVPPTTLDLSLMELGEGKSGPSWLARMLALRDEFGPFRLSFLETLLRVADWRGTEHGERCHDC